MNEPNAPEPASEVTHAPATGCCAPEAPDARTVELADALAASARGDRTAFERLYRLAAPRIFALCTRVLRREDLAEEVLQETFIQVWNRASDYDPGRATPMAWMGRIARNRSIDLLRRRKHEVEADPELHDAEQMHAQQAGPLEQTLDWSRSAAVRRCLELLSELQREAVLLAFFRGYTRVELAGALGVPVGTVKGRIREGLLRLRGCLEA